MRRYRTCARCRYAAAGTTPDGQGKALWCRRAPPSPVLTDPAKQAVSFLVPMVNPKFWCGEWRKTWRRLFKGHDA